MLDVYEELHGGGFAHSVEAWRGGVLVGGLYGVALGGAFFGESMFTRIDLGGSNASKLCLLHLNRLLEGLGFTLLDSQEKNEHMEQFGGELISFETYQQRLVSALTLAPKWVTGFDS
jgi:leucyl/phenylalanyl-tRNA--protein transferase